MAATFRLSGRSHTEPGLQANWQIPSFPIETKRVSKIGYPLECPSFFISFEYLIWPFRAGGFRFESKVLRVGS
ncbi:hypothetical protein ADU59_23300 [Pararhizobium polonicum]|uniref:Uncharacterized protein n=1 Tax=Pararhizobium polonicum TaxID=1612624 RepID=A0A1C7NVJ4_9HYPH|nr:hypothetical protein ADU59_23300 [Pararhizobium polonicum]